ncbi:MAG: flagellar filament capping protein FliD [Pseudobutyrivibrio sp.]|nr:flagellar filament capping protein FliD [Pseudobutyrivibrio sp.]
MPIRVSGMVSGLDTEGMVEALVSAYSYKKDKYVKAQTKLSWKQDAWKSLNTKIYNQYTAIGNMRYSATYNLKKAAVSDTTKATATASGNAINGIQTLEISKLASTGYMTGNDLGSGISATSTLADLGFSFGGDSSAVAHMKIKVGNVATQSADGNTTTYEDKTTELEVTGTTTISEFIKQLQAAGVSASFDADNRRIFISAKNTGAKNDFELEATDAAGLNALSSLGILDQSTVTRAQATSAFSSYIDGEGNATTELTEAISYIHNYFVDQAGTTLTDDEKAAAQTAYEEWLAEDDHQALKDYLDDLMGYTSDSDWVQAETSDVADQAAADILQATTIANAASSASLTYTEVAKINGEDAQIILNGVSYTSTTNSITVNGLTIQALATTEEDQPITVNTSTDVDGIYDKVKEFLSGYNDLINEMMKLYNADSASDYEPLTDDEKAEMSEDEIEKWEAKIKDSLLRRDGTLNGVITTMTTSMMKSYEIDGVSYSWGTFGIGTLGFLNAEKNENYAYHINGDPEDSATSGKEDKLKKALSNNPDAFIGFMTQMMSDLYKNLDTKMKSTSVKSVYTVYNDKEMASEYSNYSDLIKQWTERVKDMEDSYYKKFAQMESALATLQSNSSSLTSMLG